MNVLTLLGSPRKQGNTAHVLAWVEATLARAGHVVERCWVDDYTITGCRECDACKDGKAELCAVYDDGIKMLHKIIESDMVVLAAPVFCWGFPGPMKTLLDRMYCLAGELNDGVNYTTRIEGKPLALVVTAGGPEKDNADLLVKAYQAMTAYMKAVPAGALVIAECMGPESLDDAVQARAEAFGEALAASLCAKDDEND